MSSPMADASHEEMDRPPSVLQYGRDELLGFQEAVGHLQDEWWAHHLKDLGPGVAEELQELQAVPDTSHLRRRSKNSERRQRSKAKREALHALSINELGSDKDDREEYENSVEESLDAIVQRVSENTGGRRHVGKGKGSRNYKSFHPEDIPEPESFQPQAFAVEGEPNFEAGPPEDGWEYLRRVKYEAARCPRVVVAQIDPTKLVSEQTPYMPEIPEIPACPSDLLPSKEWEEHFLGQFSLLRMYLQALSNIRVPPTFPSERIPSLRNKSAWEVRCFGSVTSVEDEELKELDFVTTKEPKAVPGDEDSAPQAETRSLPSVDSTKLETDNAASESRSELLDGDKELLEPLIEFVESHIDPLVNAGSMESSYVIDLGLITDYAPNYQLEESYDEAEYFLCGEPAEAEEGIDTLKEDDPSVSVKSFDSPTSNIMEMGDMEGKSFEIITHFEHLSVCEPEGQVGDEGKGLLSTNPIPSSTEAEQPISADCEGSVGVFANTVVHAEVGSFIGIEIQADQLSTFEDIESLIQSTPPSGNYELVERGDDQLETADFMTSFDGDSWTLDEAEFGEPCVGIDSQFDSLTVQDPDLVQDELDVNFSDADILEVDDVHLPADDFVDSLIGLEIYHSGNVLVDETVDGLDASGYSTEFKIDGPLEELFAKVFQLVGVSQLPFIHLLLRLDEVCRAALFRHHVAWLENVNGLPKDRALWFVALSAVVDMPLDSQTSAAFRAMLRHCSGVRALKQSRDDEDLYLLNVLITVSGVFFGQAEAALP